MSTISLNGSALGNSLQALLMCDDIEPGDSPSYEICKQILAYHPLGDKMATAPIRIALSQEREISIPNSPESRVKKAFLEERKTINADKYTLNTMRLARAYGIASIALLVDGVDPSTPIDYSKLHGAKISFNVLDPLNTAGSLVLNQDPNAPDFQKTTNISVNGKIYHPSRTVIVLNEDPLYIQYTTSAFGFVGRSVYQRALFPLKSFIQSMVTDDMVTRKAGVLVAMMRAAGSIIDNLMQKFAGIKRALLKEARTDNVISIDLDEKIETLNMQNIDGAYGMARKNILENIAVAADMPAILLNNETFAEGFGEGVEDAKSVVRYVNRIRMEMHPLYSFFDRIVQYRAWNPDFYKTIQADFPDQYGKVTYQAAFYQWVNSFTATWPSLLIEPESERIKVDDVKLKAVIALVEVLMPAVDPENKAIVIEWAADKFNALKLLFEGSPLTMDFDALREYVPPEAAAPKEPGEPKPFAASDAERPGRRAYNDAIVALLKPAERKRAEA